MTEYVIKKIVTDHDVSFTARKAVKPPCVADHRARNQPRATSAIFREDHPCSALSLGDIRTFSNHVIGYVFQATNYKEII